MTTLGGQVTARQSALIPGLYADEAMAGLVGRLTGEDIVTVADPVERHVLNILHRQGDTTAHRVTPLTRAGLRRTVLNFAYTTTDFRPQSTGSARKLYA